MNGFFNWYKSCNIFLKILLFFIPLLMGILWVIGSFTKFDRLVMFVIGLLVGGILINVFFGSYVTAAVEWIVETFNNIFNSAVIAFEVL